MTQQNALPEQAHVPPENGVEPRVQDERLWATLCHLSSLIFVAGVPLGHIFGPLLMWLLKRNESEFVDQQGAESLNFQVSMTLYALFLLIFGTGIGILLTASGQQYYLVGVPMILGGIFSFPVILLLDILLVIVGSIKANHGEDFRYPLTIRLF